VPQLAQVEIAAAAGSPSGRDRSPQVGEGSLHQPLAARSVEDRLIVIQRSRKRAEGSERLRRQPDASELAVLRHLDAARAVERAADRCATIRDVQVATAERRELAWPDVGVGRKQDDGGGFVAEVAVVIARDLGKLLDLALRQRSDHLSADRHRRPNMRRDEQGLEWRGGGALMATTVRQACSVGARRRAPRWAGAPSGASPSPG
jgi:hypothetical protein